MRALSTGLAVLALLAPTAGAKENLHCYFSVPPEGVEITADASSGEKSMQIAAEMHYGVQPILGPKTICGQLDTLDRTFIDEFLERHECTAASDVGVEIAKRFDPASNPTPTQFVALREKYPDEMTALCDVVSGVTLPSSAVLTDDAALDAWTAATGEALDAADAILEEIRQLEAATDGATTTD